MTSDLITPPPPPKPTADAAPVFSQKLRVSASSRQLSLLFRRVGLSLRSGVDVLKIWEQESNRGPARHRRMMEEVYAEIRQGNPLHQAFRACQGYIPSLAIHLVQVGDQTGRTEEVLLKLAEHYEHQVSVRREFIQGITWPAVQLAMAVGVIGLVIWVSGALGMDILGFGLLGASGVLIFLTTVSAIVAALGMAALGLLRGWFGAAPLALAMRIPAIGGCLRDFAVGRLTWSLSMALDAGVDAREAMRLALQSTQNAFYTIHERTVDQVLRRGGQFHESLRATDAFRDEFLDTLEAAELSGTQSESLDRLSRDYEERARLAAKILTQVATYLVWAMVAGMLIFMIFRMAFTYLGIINSALNFEI